MKHLVLVRSLQNKAWLRTKNYALATKISLMETITNKPLCTMLSTAVTVGQHGHTTVPSVTHPQCRYDIQQQYPPHTAPDQKKRQEDCENLVAHIFSHIPRLLLHFTALLWIGSDQVFPLSTSSTVSSPQTAASLSSTIFSPFLFVCNTKRPRHMVMLCYWNQHKQDAWQHVFIRLLTQRFIRTH